MGEAEEMLIAQKKKQDSKELGTRWRGKIEFLTWCFVQQ